ncbi:MAG: hypothetical protein ABGA11_03465 [Liquorilactobacillus hordei]|uniref:Uncharacterized protein n=1 Tax=Liquorilactobacillus hordei TaxID=468911 RepID=A0A3Q8CL84_9LACO|nr:hypothetical protein [Liquorilactobacillus hordei]AUJ29055.1 hypothetical protein BSQ49_01820 [Liquorilactobacillus hordei]
MTEENYEMIIQNINSGSLDVKTKEQAVTILNQEFSPIEIEKNAMQNIKSKKLQVTSENKMALEMMKLDLQKTKSKLKKKVLKQAIKILKEEIKDEQK